MDVPYDLQVLVEKGIPFESFREYIHVAVYVGNLRIDFWPTTGTWKTKEPTTRRGVGAISLLKFIRQVKKNNKAKSAKH